MRLQLAIAAFATASASACASHQSTRVRADTHMHEDRTTRVTSPRVQAKVQQGESVEIDGHWKADVISAATPVMAAPDTVSRASEYTETRHETGVGADWEVDSGTTLGGSYTLSSEPDHLGHTLTLSLSRELFDKQSTVSFGGRVNRNEVGAVDMPAFERKLWVLSGNVGWTQILNRAALVRLSYGLTGRNGYQANPYRYVPIWDHSADEPRNVVPENVPRHRLRHSMEILGSVALSHHLFVRSAYRFYRDSWSVQSHTLRGAVWWEHPDDWLRLRFRTRGYTQSGAYFFEDQYTQLARYRTGDYRLSTLSKLEGGLRAEVRLATLPVGRRLAGIASFDLVRYWFHSYPVFDSMFARIATLSLQMEFP